MIRTVTFDFYRVTIKDSAQPFEEILTSVGSIVPSQRNVDYKDHFIRLQEIEFRDPVYLGYLVKVRMSDLPLVVGKSDDDVKPLSSSLKKDQGLGDETFFLYDPLTKVLILQKNRAGVGPFGFVYYFEKKVANISEIELYPIMELEALQKLQKMAVIRKFELSFAKPENFTYLRESKIPLSQVLDLMDEQGANTIHVRLSMGHKKGSMVSDLKNQILKFLRITRSLNSEPHRLRITGRLYSEDGPREVVDLIEQKMVERANIPVIDRHLDKNHCYKELYKLYLKRRESLQEMFSKCGD